MTLSRRVPLSTGIGVSFLLACALLLAGCAGWGTTGSPPTGPSTAPTQSSPSSPAAESTPGSASGPILANLPTACYGLGEEDCSRVAGQISTLLTADDPPVRYVQVGPFGCAGDQRCPTTLAARPEGDVTLETPNGALSFHVTMRGGILDAQRQEAFGVLLQPSTRPPLPAAGQPLTLGHCGLWSGVDLGGSFWDPIGYVDSDHGDAINAASGTFVMVGPDRALFTSNDGFAVQLLRRAGEKYLPFCD